MYHFILPPSLQTPNGKMTAVDHLSMDMFEDQITSLLGHNGAGEFSMSTATITLYIRTICTQITLIHRHITYNYIIHTHHVHTNYTHTHITYNYIIHTHHVYIVKHTCTAHLLTVLLHDLVVDDWYII